MEQSPSSVIFGDIEIIFLVPKRMFVTGLLACCVTVLSTGNENENNSSVCNVSFLCSLLCLSCLDTDFHLARFTTC